METGTINGKARNQEGNATLGRDNVTNLKGGPTPRIPYTALSEPYDKVMDDKATRKAEDEQPHACRECGTVKWGMKGMWYHVGGVGEVFQYTCEPCRASNWRESCKASRILRLAMNLAMNRVGA